MESQQISQQVVRSNIWRILAMRGAAAGMAVTIPTIVVVWKECGLSQTEIHLLQALFSLALILCEVPSGYLADVFGNRRMLFLGALLNCVGAAAFVSAYTFNQFLIGEILLAIGFALASGADEALLYQSLAARRKAEKFSLLLGRLFFYGSVAGAAFCLLGSLLATVSLRLPFVVSAVCLFGQAVLAAGLRDVDSVHYLQGRWRKVLTDLWRSCSNHEIRKLLVLSALFTASVQVVLWFYQPLMLQWEIPLVWYGIVFAAMNAICGVSSSVASRLRAGISSRTLFLLGVLMIVGGYELLSVTTTAWGVILFSLQQIVRGVSQVILAGELNRRVEPAARASLASVRSMSGRLVYAVLLVPLGQLADDAGIPTALSLLGGGVILLFLSGYLLLFLLHVWEQKVVTR